MYKNFVPAYAISNENQRWITSLFPNVQRILTVAGSGDQAMFYAINTPAHIETFDIAHFAHVIQDIKTTALKVLNHKEYCELIESINDICCDYTKAKHINKVLPHLPFASKEILDKYGKYANFNRGTMYPEHLPTQSEYARMQTIITQPFNFILAPLNKLHENISGQYDIINLSNIFDIFTKHEQLQVVSNLTPYLTIGGRILYIAQACAHDYKDAQTTKPETGQEFKYEDTFTNPYERNIRIISFQRSR